MGGACSTLEGNNCTQKHQWRGLLTVYTLVVTICTTCYIMKIRSAHTAVFMCFVWISEQTAIISLYNIN
jgi:hypothetical protein